jgi:hypothetical protein
MSASPELPRSSTSSDLSPSLLYFSGTFTDRERSDVLQAVEQLESTLNDLPNLPPSAGARWSVVAEPDGLVAMSRLGVRYVFAAASLEAVLDKVMRWATQNTPTRDTTGDRASNSSLARDRVSRGPEHREQT